MCSWRGINAFQLSLVPQLKTTLCPKGLLSLSLSLSRIHTLMLVLLTGCTLMCWYSFSSSCNTSSCFRTDSCWNSPRSTCMGAKQRTLWVWVACETLPLRVNMHFETEGFHYHHLFSLLPEMFYLLAERINSVSLNVFNFSWQKCKYVSELSSFLCTSLKNWLYFKRKFNPKQHCK